MKIVKFSLRQPVLVNLVTVLIIIAGLVSWLKMPREVFPTIQRRTITVTTIYPGVAPGEIEELVTIPLERTIATVDDVEQITATSSEGRSVIKIEVKDGVTDISRVLLDVQTAVARVGDLPADAEDPVVRADKMQMPMLWLALGANVPEKELRDLATDLKNDLEDIPGVSEVMLQGLRKPQITVEVDPDRLVARSLTIADVMQAIGRKHANVPGGTIYGQRGQYLIRTMGRFAGAEAVKPIVVRSNEKGTVTVGDVARVHESFEDKEVESRVDGKLAAFLIVQRRTDADAIKVTEKIRAYLAKTKLRYPKGAEVVVVWDSSKLVKRRQRTLYQNGLMGLGLVIVLLFIFLDWRMALMTSLGIPVAFFGTFILMRLMGMSLNMISMFALIMVLGMLVDDAVIVVENFYRHLMMGKSRLEAALIGCSQVVWPVLAAVSTTLVAYLVLIRLPGDMGQVMRILPMVVGAALLVSIIEALFILPSHLYEFARRNPGVTEPSPDEKGNLLNPITPLPESPHTENGATGPSHEARWFVHFQRGFRWIVTRVTRFWYVSLPLLLFGFVFVAFMAAKGNRFVPFPETTIERFDISLELPVGTKLERTGQAVRLFEKKLATYPKRVIESYICRVGMRSLDPTRQVPGTHLATCSILMAKDGKGPVSALALLKELRPYVNNLPGLEQTQVTFQRAGPPAGNPIEIQVRGDDVKRIMAVVDGTIKVARGIKGVTDVTHDLDDGKRELQVEVDEYAAARRGLDVTTVGIAVRNAFGGGVAAKLQRGEDEIDVLVRFPDRLRHRASEIEALQIRSPRGGMVPFKTVASLRETVGPTNLVRVDRKRTVTIYGQVNTKITSDQQANDEIRAGIENLRKRYPDVEVTYAGSQKRSRELTGGLFEAFLLALLLIYIILATVFGSFIQPFIILFGSVPFALVGVLVGLKVHNLPISIIAVLGFVGLVGIVVNDSLVLVDFVNKARAEGLGIKQAVVDAAVKRVRPVILTSVTTIAGLLPLAGGWFGAEEFLQPMAVALVWGLVFTTVLTLFVVPCYVLLVDTIKRALLWPFRAIGRARRRGTEAA